MREETEERKGSGPCGLVATETGEERFQNTWSKEAKVACMGGENAGEKRRLEKNGDEEESGGDTGHPGDGKGDGDGKEEDFLVRQGGSEAKKEGVEEVKRVHGDGGLEERNADDGGHAEEEVKVKVEGAEIFLEGLANGPKKPEKNKKEDRVCGGGGNENEGDHPPKFTLKDECGVEFQDGEKAGRGEVEEPAGGVHGDEATGEMRDGPPTEMLFEEVGPTGGAHEPGGRSGLNGDFFPVEVLGAGVLLEVLLKHNEDGPDDRGVVLKADLGDEIGDDVEQAMGVDDGKGSGRGGSVGDLLVGSFGEVFDDIGKEFQLLDEMGKLGGVDLGELGLQHGETMEQVVHDLGGDAGGPALGKGGDFGHESKGEGKRGGRQAEAGVDSEKGVG